MAYLKKIPITDKAQKSTQQLYTTTTEWIKEIIPGNTFADKINNLTIFYQKYYGTSLLESHIDELRQLFEGETKK